MSTKAPIVVVGAGPVGLLTAVGFSEVRPVRLVDVNETLIQRLSRGEETIQEPGLKERLATAREQGRLSFHTDVEGAVRDGDARLVFIAVGTPSSDRQEEGAPNQADVSAVRAVIKRLFRSERIAIVMKSTVPPGFGRAIVAEAQAAGTPITYLSCPEFLQEGEAFGRLDTPDRIVVGCDADCWASQELRYLHEELYGELLEARAELYMEMDLTSAELVKHSSNFHLAMRISFANQIAAVCEELGADVAEVMRGVSADRRIGDAFLEAGVGFGGSCFTKDIRALLHVATTQSVPFPIADAVLHANAYQAERAVEKLALRLDGLEGRRVTLLGIAFKPDTDDVRASPAFALANHLRIKGATVAAWDPSQSARDGSVRCTTSRSPLELLQCDEVFDSYQEALERADAAVIVTAWPVIANLDWLSVADIMAGDFVLDGRNVAVPDDVRSAGLRYEGIGRESRGLTQPTGAGDGAIR